MTKHEILNKLIPYYEECIEELRRMDDLTKLEIKKYIQHKDINQGICYAMLNLFDISFSVVLKPPKWITRNCRPNSNYWGETPHHMIDVGTINDCIEALQIRVDIMKKELLIID